jgi:hypothetical protein
MLRAGSSLGAESCSGTWTCATTRVTTTAGHCSVSRQGLQRQWSCSRFLSSDSWSCVSRTASLRSLSSERSCSKPYVYHIHIHSHSCNRSSRSSSSSSSSSSHRRHRRRHRHRRRRRRGGSNSSSNSSRTKTSVRRHWSQVLCPRKASRWKVMSAMAILLHRKSSSSHQLDDVEGLSQSWRSRMAELSWLLLHRKHSTGSRGRSSSSRRSSGQLDDAEGLSQAWRSRMAELSPRHRHHRAVGPAATEVALTR